MTGIGWQPISSATDLVKDLASATEAVWEPGMGRVRIGYGLGLEVFAFWITPGAEALWCQLPDLPFRL
jgi:hypothetical protein